ncbi:hypothetical protein BV898_00532 [Hypsibius exemplaris]|uniref:G-protein coupled receptors family 1 profile domain-containing protein n=1 Tax=Hypsibius exemplaris TaxID=2072580 RepID=A0A1W0XDP4_HYPEX|nr:hypothetical protein BV898_00532 [Hypsibius exemplaris]
MAIKIVGLGNSSLNASLTIIIQSSSNSSFTIKKSFNTFLPYVFVILCIGVVVLNSFVLVAFVKNRNLRTPFNIYIINLVLADLLQALFDLPFTLLGEFTPIWPLGRAGCNFALYAKWVFSAAVRNTHSLISLNRMWAVFMPISYRERHTRAIATALCLGTWVYVHIFLLPGLVLDSVVYRLDGDSCQLNTTAQRDWALPSQVVVYNSSVFIIGISYPLIWWKLRQRLKVDPGQKKEVEMRPVGPYRHACLCAPETSVRGTNDVAARNGREIDDLFTRRNGQLRMGETNEQNPANGSLDGQIPTGQRDPSRPSQSFIVLTYLVVGVIFCWSPIMIYFTMQIVTGYNNNLHYVAGTLLYYFNSLLDPFFFALAMAPLRATLWRILSLV